MTTAVIWVPTMIATAVAMEGWAALLHEHVWHGLLWRVHRTHHRARHGRWEANDVLSVTHAPIAMALILWGCVGTPGALREIAYGVGLGMTAFGVAYLTFHDGLVHGRLPVASLRKIAAVDLWCRAHEVHHQRNDGPYGFFWVPRAVRARLEESDRTISGGEPRGRGGRQGEGAIRWK
jgi:beta-carotene 3-hydroxylase